MMRARADWPAQTTLNRFHAQVAEEIMLEVGYDGEADKELIARVKDLLLKKNLARPPLPTPLKGQSPPSIRS